VGHTIDECFAYNGGSAGKYPDWYKGSRRIHLSPDTRAADRRKEMLKKVGASARMAEPDDEAGDPSRDAALANYGQVSDEESNSLLNRIDGAFAFLTDGFMEEVESVDSSEKITVNASALNLNELQENTINHDTGATRHIFRDRRFFHDYILLDEPLKVHGFGSKLSAVAVGKGTIILQSKIGNSYRNFSLSNVLHIPSARCNLISGSRLDQKGVSTRTGNGKITYLNKHNTCFAIGSIVRDLYKMDVTPVISPNSDPRNTSSTPQSEASVIASMVPDITRLFNPGTESAKNKRLGFTTV